MDFKESCITVAFAFGLLFLVVGGSLGVAYLIAGWLGLSDGWVTAIMFISAFNIVFWGNIITGYKRGYPKIEGVDG